SETFVQSGLRLSRQSASHFAANRRRGVLRERISASPVKRRNRSEQPHVALLNQVEKVDAGPRVFSGYRDYKPQVGLDHFTLCLSNLSFSGDDRLMNSLDFFSRYGVFALQIPQRLPERLLLAFQFFDFCALFGSETAFYQVRAGFERSDLFHHRVNRSDEAPSNSGPEAKRPHSPRSLD